LIPGNEDGRVDTGSSQNASDSDISSSSTELSTLFQTPMRWWQLTTNVPSNPVTVKESEDTKEILKKKATKVSIPESI
jgi:hypothetical protein